MIRRFAKNILESIADAGEKFLDLRLSGGSTRVLFNLCEDLISHKGVASGIALAREIVHRYQRLEHDEKLTFFQELNQKMGPDMTRIGAAASAFNRAPNAETLQALSAAMASNRQRLFSRMNMAPNSTPAIVALRQDLLGFLREHPDLQAVDDDLKLLLTSWFNPGLLSLERLSWDTEASILEKIIQYEAVHTIENWHDLKQRLVADRICFAYFHPALEDEPLIFVEIALTRGISSSVQAIFQGDGQKGEEPDTAIFYSINNCQEGLRQIPLGNFLIKRVVAELARDLPAIKTYCTLSPVTGFASWLHSELASGETNLFSKKEKETLSLVQKPEWQHSAEQRRLLEKPLVKACAIYLAKAKRAGRPLNSVAKFHFGNGASLHRINWMGDTSPHGMSEYFGLMVNYLYDLKQIESNHEAYVENGELAISKWIKTILASKS